MFFIFSGIVETAKNLNTTFVTSYTLSIVAKDGYNPPAVSNTTTLKIHVTKTPSIPMSSISIGTDSMSTTLDTSGYSYLTVVRYEVLVQEYEPTVSNCKYIMILLIKGITDREAQS